jgi:hypothetical protein
MSVFVVTLSFLLLPLSSQQTNRKSVRLIFPEKSLTIFLPDESGFGNVAICGATSSEADQGNALEISGVGTVAYGDSILLLKQDAPIIVNGKRYPKMRNAVLHKSGKFIPNAFVRWFK